MYNEDVILLKHCNIANQLQNSAESLLQDCDNVKMSIFCNFAMKRYSNIAV